MTEYIQAEQDIKKAQDRLIKAARTKDVGDPLELQSKIIKMVVRGDEAWTAESGAVTRCIDLNTGKTKRIYQGHLGPVTCLAFYKPESFREPCLITGAWDQKIKVWMTSSKDLVCTTNGHDDFLKSLVVIPSLRLLASGSSDKSVKLWDLSVLEDSGNAILPLPLIGSLTGHTRPVDCLSVDGSSSLDPPLLYSGDSMGVIKVWSLDIMVKQNGTRSIRGKVVEEHKRHRTGVCAMIVDEGRIWSGSSDETIMLQSSTGPSGSTTLIHPTITLNAPVRVLLPLSSTSIARPLLLAASADLITVWDVVSFGELPSDGGGTAERIGIIDAHSHDITSMNVWIRTVSSFGKPDKNASKGSESITPTRREAWIVSSSLDGTIRRWKLDAILNGEYERQIKATFEQTTKKPDASGIPGFVLSEEEERELAELMSDEEDA